jgi:hypothetical protein
MVQKILSAIRPSTLTIPEIASELLTLVRDEVGWAATLQFVAGLPDGTRRLPLVREQELLARAETGQAIDAIGHLEELIATEGETPERQGLIGGRYKRLWKAEQKARIARGEKTASADERRFLNKAIDHYTRGMELDYNQYYCSCNLPALFRARGKGNDLQRAEVVDQMVLAACDRALKRKEGDEWLRPTLLGTAFRARDVQKAEELADQVEEEGAVAWKLESTLSDLTTSVEQATGDPAHDELEAILRRLEQLEK